jgi:predicted O-methyltransferase YrrM
METLTINYHSESSELCEIGKKYDTDKSSQRSHITHYRHCHPYTLFYDSLFKNRRNEPLQIAELGILYGGSLLMWKDYFKHATIYGFECNDKLIDKFKKNCDNDRITLAKIDVKHADSIIDAFRTLNVMYDIIIEDTTHKFEDQLRVIEHVHPYLKPGGILIIEDIFKSVDVNDYRIALQSLLHHFQTYYFVELDHVNKYSAQWNNDKLFVLVKREEPH